MNINSGETYVTNQAKNTKRNKTTEKQNKTTQKTHKQDT